MMGREYVFCPYYKDEAKNRKPFAHSPITNFEGKHNFATTRKLACARCYQLVKSNPWYDYILVRRYPGGYMKSRVREDIGTAKYIGPGGRKGMVLWTDLRTNRVYKLSAKGELIELSAEDIFDMRRM